MTWFQSAANQSAATAAHAEVVSFVSLDFPSGVLRLHSRVGDIVWGGYTWQGLGKLGTIEALREDAELRPTAITLTLSGVDDALLASALAEDYHGRPVIIYQGLLNVSTLVLAADPEQLFVGLMDYATVSAGSGTGTITVHCESEIARWQRQRNLMNTHESQQLLYPGDRFFDMVPTIQSRVIDWTKKGVWGSSTGTSQQFRNVAPR